MYVILVNDDPIDNFVRVTDTNAGNAEVWRGVIPGHESREIRCQTDAAGFNNIITYQDNNAGVGRSLLHDGDRVSL